MGISSASYFYNEFHVLKILLILTLINIILQIYKVQNFLKIKSKVLIKVFNFFKYFQNNILMKIQLWIFLESYLFLFLLSIR